MSRERWGTFSVRDHTFKQPFAADVLMYDRLIVPYPPNYRRQDWNDKQWDPDRLDKVLGILRTDAADPKRHAIKVSWDGHAEQLYEKRRIETANGLNWETNFRATANTIAIDLLPDPPEGVIPVAVVANYSTVKEADSEWIPNDNQDRNRTLTLALAHQFLVPDPSRKSDFELLQEAVDLADDDGFRKKRAQMYKWQDDIIRSGISDKKALEEMAQYIDEYGRLTKDAVGSVYKKFAFTLIPISLSVLSGVSAMHGAAGVAPLAPLAGLGAITSLLKFWVFDRKPSVPTEDCQAAAMLHTAQQELGWRPLEINEHRKLDDATPPQNPQ